MPEIDQFVPAEDHQLRVALQDVQARLGALTLLFLESGQITEADFNGAVARVDRFLEERRTKNAKQSSDEHRETLQWHLRQISQLVTSCFPGSQVDVILPRLRADLERDGVYIRVIGELEPTHAATMEYHLQILLQQKFGESEYSSWLFPATFLLLPRELADADPLSLKFDILARAAAIIAS